LVGQQRVKNEWHVRSDVVQCHVAEKSEANATEFCHKQLGFIGRFSVFGWLELPITAWLSTRSYSD
jgi:hypothetical protein